MSDYMFMLESHLSSEQFRVVGEMQSLANASGVSLFLTGGAMRDMIAGFPVRDLDFTVEGNALKFAKTLEQKHGVKVLSTDDQKKSAELLFPNGVRAEVAMARSERYTKSGGRPQISPTTIHEDLRGRDFTVNSIGLSLNRASLGLLIDPANGIGDIANKELRANHNYSFYDDPSRVLRMVRFKTRLGYVVAERTRSQYENAREAGVLDKISEDALAAEVRHMAKEPNSEDLIKALAEENLLTLVSPALPTAKLDHHLLSKLQKARQLPPFGWESDIDALSLFLEVLCENLNAKERSSLAKAAGLGRAELGHWQKLEASSKKLEKALKSPKLHKPSHIYQALTDVPGEQILYLAVYSEQRLVQDRIKNYFQKYLPASREVTDDMVVAEGVKPGTPKFQKLKLEMVLKRLDARPKKPEPVPEPPPPPPMSGFARGTGIRQAR